MRPNITFIWENKPQIWYIHRPLVPATPGGRSIYDTFTIALSNNWISKTEKIRLYNPLTTASYDLDFEDFESGEHIFKGVLTSQ